jgi:hypothetical protein
MEGLANLAFQSTADTVARRLHRSDACCGFRLRGHRHSVTRSRRTVEAVRFVPSDLLRLPERERRMRWRFLAASVLITCAAAAVSGLILYERIIVPLLPTVRSVPLWWWGLAASHVWLTALFLGWRTGSVREVVSASVACAIGADVYLYWGLDHAPARVRESASSRNKSSDILDCDASHGCAASSLARCGWTYGEASRN